MIEDGTEKEQINWWYCTIHHITMQSLRSDREGVGYNIRLADTRHDNYHSNVVNIVYHDLGFTAKSTLHFIRSRSRLSMSSKIISYAIEVGICRLFSKYYVPQTSDFRHEAKGRKLQPVEVKWDMLGCHQIISSSSNVWILFSHRTLITRNRWSIFRAFPWQGQTIEQRIFQPMKSWWCIMMCVS